MKKKYEKPNLTIFSIIGNENICGGCEDGVKVSENDTLKELFGLHYGNFDGVLTKDEVKNLFGMEPQCAEQVMGYCKFTSSYDKIAWS